MLQKLLSFLSFLAGLLGFSRKAHSKPKFHICEIETATLNVLEQPRRTFKDIESLAESIKEISQMHPVIVIRLSEEECKKHLGEVNDLWESSFDIKELRARSDGSYDILLAGERRFRAVSLNGSKTITASLWKGVLSIPAFKAQFQENIHSSVPPAEEAYAHKQFFLYLKRNGNPNLSVAEFARKYAGRSASTVHESLRFCELPDKVRALIEETVIPYGYGYGLFRLQNEGLDENALMAFAADGLIRRLTVLKFEARVSEFIEVKKSGQTNLFEFSEEDFKKERRMVVEKNTVEYLWANEAYLKRLIALVESGKLGEGDSPYSSGSPRRRLSALVDFLQLSLSHMENLGPRKIKKLRGALEALESDTDVVVH